MKKLLLILLSLVFAVVAYAAIDTLEGTATSGMSKWEGQTVASGGGDYSDILFHYDAENTVDSTKPSGGSKITGTNGGMVFSTSSPPVGSYWMFRGTGYDTMTFPLTTAVFDKTEGVMGFWLRPSSDASLTDYDIVYIHESTSNRVLIFWRNSPDYRLALKWTGNGTSLQYISTYQLSVNTSYYITGSWNVSTGDLTLGIYSSAGAELESGTAVGSITAMSTDPDELIFGYSDAVDMDQWIDNFVLSNDSDRNLVPIRDNESYE